MLEAHWSPGVWPPTNRPSCPALPLPAHRLGLWGGVSLPLPPPLPLPPSLYLSISLSLSQTHPISELCGRGADLKYALSPIRHRGCVLGADLFVGADDLPQRTKDRCPLRNVWSQWGNDGDELYFAATYNTVVRCSRALSLPLCRCCLLAA